MTDESLEPTLPDDADNGDEVTDVAPDELEASKEPEAAQPTTRVIDMHADRETGLEAAATAIRDGLVIVLPTDTVYGIGADAMNADAVQRLLDAKVRGRDMPPPVLISDAIALGSLVDEVPDAARALTKAFWPGALTVILPSQSGLRMDLGETRGTIAVRVPDHDVARDLLRRTGPLAVSSANISGLPAAHSVRQAEEMLADSVELYLDAGPVSGGEPSSIVDFSVNRNGRLVRLGALSVAQLLEHAPLLDAGEFAPEPEPEAADEAAEREAMSDAEPASEPTAGEAPPFPDPVELRDEDDHQGV